VISAQMPDRPEVDVYATGVLADLQTLARCLNPGWLRSTPWPAWLPRHPFAGSMVAPQPWRRHGVRHSLRRLRQNALHRAQWRGYYAEGKTPGIGRVGTGWTPRRALLDLARHIEGRTR